MEWLLSFCESPDCSNLLFALLHSLWQGALIAALLYLFFRTESPKGENARYNASLIAMAAVVLCVLFTFSILNFRSDATTKTNAFDGVKQQENIAAVESLKNIVQAESIEVQSVIEDAQIYVEAKRNIIGYGWGPLGGAINSGTDKGTFNATPLPLDSKYCIIAFEDRSFGVSEIIKISEKNPIVNIDIDVPEGLDIHGRLVDADGNPVRLPVDIATEIKRDKIYYSHSGPEIWPDKDGRFVFENVNPGPYGKCAIVVKGAEGYQHAEHEIIDFSEQILIQLKKGLRATGVVIDEDTGLPIPEVEVRAYRRINQNGHEISESIEAEEATNEKGEFVLTCMSEGAYRLILSSVGYYVDSNHEITGGQDEPSYFKFHRVKAQ